MYRLVMDPHSRDVVKVAAARVCGMGDAREIRAESVDLMESTALLQTQRETLQLALSSPELHELMAEFSNQLTSTLFSRPSAGRSWHKSQGSADIFAPKPFGARPT
jgi:hypothetical protein